VSGPRGAGPLSPSAERPVAVPAVSRLRTVTLTAATLVCFAANSLLCRAALRPRLIDAATFTSIRLVSGAAALALILAVTRRARPAGGSIGSAFALFLYAAAFSLSYVRIGAGVGALLLFGAVQVTMIGWSVATGARPGPVQWLGIAVALGGLAYLGLPGASAPDPIGALLMITAGVAWGAYSLRGRAARDSLAANADNFLRAVPLTIGLSVALLSGRAATGHGILLAVASGALTSGGGYSLWYAVVPTLGATRAAAVQLAVPVLAGLGATALLGESLTARIVISGAAILAGIALTLRRR
jgi:drug/metabolite transporter (DMT)-like permease